jgi:hypothetical protein
VDVDQVSRYPIPEVAPKIRRTLVDFMTTAQLEALKAAPATNPLKKVSQ